MRRREMLWAVVVAVLVWGGSALADELKIGYVDAQAVLDQSKPGQASKEVLEQYVKSRQQLIDTDEEEIRQLEEDLKKQSAVLSADAQKEKQEALQRKYISYQKRAGELTKEVQDRRAEVLKDFNRQLVQAVQHVAEQGGYAMVLDKETEGGVVLYAKEPMNLTEQVVKELDRMAAAGEAAPKPSSKTDKSGSSGKSP
ncbi:MAG TPA: OmpH family outer membrane protein [Nitrospiria bacterium]|nr:OmpH family outer membrane protein [Nitrospiria bacterium]